MNHDIFISYSSQNNDAAQAICHVLEENGIRCWMAPRNIPPGSDYGDVIVDAIKECKAVVVLFSEKAATSQYVKSEINVAFEEQKTIIPFRLDKTPLTGQNRLILNKIHWIDAYPDYKTKFNDLVDAVSNSIGKEVQIERDAAIRHNEIKHFKKPITVGVSVIVFVLLSCFMYPVIVRHFHVYSYDKQGIHVRVKGLDAEKEEALSSILDEMVLVESGAFMMGNTPEMADYLTDQDSLSSNVHEVEVDKFYICKYEVTQKQWKAFLPTSGKCIVDGENNTAMDMLSWEDAKAFADTLTAITGLPFALPSEAQWEFAARGGNKSHHYIFSGNNDATEVGWTSFENGISSAHEVGGKRYNELGVYDMTGNVFEWCEDFFELYPLDRALNPTGPQKGMNRVLRGGDFRIDNLYDMKVSTRYFDSPFVNRRGAGVRLVINTKQ